MELESRNKRIFQQNQLSSSSQHNEILLTHTSFNHKAASLSGSDCSLRLSPEPERWDTNEGDRPPHIEQILEDQGDSIPVRDKESSALRELTFDVDVKVG